MGGDWGNEPGWWDCLAVFSAGQILIWGTVWLILHI